MSAYAFDELIRFDVWEKELLCQLKELLSKPLTEESRDQVSEIVNQLFTLLPVQFDAKTCDDEYMQDVLDEFPSWQTQINALRVEQALLYEDLRDIRDHLRDGADSMETVKALAPVILQWMERLRKHEVEEQRLSQLALNLELGSPGD